MVFADDIVRALLAVRHQVAVGETNAVQALVAEDAGAYKYRETGAPKPGHVDLVGS